MKKIVMVGPVYPYKGGISHYTSLMYQSLSQEFNVDMISFKLQYPKFLFKKEQKDFENDILKIDSTKFLINTINPFNIIRVAIKIKKMKPDILIMQWWHPYFAPCYILLMSFIGKCKKLFICHNVFPHERFPMDRLLSKIALQKGNCYILHSKMDTDDLKSIIKEPKFIQTVHPTYNMFKIKDLTNEESRKILNISKNEKVILFFGFIREYKGLDILIEAIPGVINKLQNIKLLIVGDFDSNKEKYQNRIEELKIGKNIEIYDGYIADKDIEKFFASTNLVVLPYRKATQSGIVQIAYGFEKPVIVTNVGGLPDVVVDNKTGYVVESENVEELSNAIVKYFKENKEVEFAKEVRQEAFRFSWDRMKENIGTLIT